MKLSKPNPRMYDVVVVGAGPIGLATAIGLRKRGIENILVVDQARTFRQVGQVVDVLPNGLKALKYLDQLAYEELKKTAGITTGSKKSQNTSPKWLQKNLEGQMIRETPLNYDDWFQKYGEGRLSISWYNLQTTLRNQLPQDRVKANHRCINVVDEPEAGCVRVDCVSDTSVETNPYAYWGEEEKDSNTQPQKSETKFFRAKLVVAADGINSTIRRVLYADSPDRAFAKPEYSGYAAISCREINEIPNEVRTELLDKFLQNSPIVTISNDKISRDTACMEDPRIILFNRQSDQLGYIIHLVVALNSLQDTSGSSLIDLAVRELEKASFPNVFKELVRISPPDNMQHRLYYIHRAVISDSIQLPSIINSNIDSYSGKIKPPWSIGRIVLVGDAAHGMPPFAAQGANQGFEDALAVVKVISEIAQNNNWDDTQYIAKAFEKYESIRRPLMIYIQQATLRRFNYSSNDKEYQEYNRQVYARNFFSI